MRVLRAGDGQYRTHMFEMTPIVSEVTGKIKRCVCAWGKRSGGSALSGWPVGGCCCCLLGWRDHACFRGVRTSAAATVAGISLVCF